MSKRDIILFDIGRKTTGFSEKNLRESSEPAPLSTVVIPFHPSFILRSAHRTNQSFFGWFSYGVYYDGIEQAPAASLASGLYLENPYIRVFLYENHSHLGGYITGFDSNVKGFFCLFLPYFALFFLDISC